MRTAMGWKYKPLCDYLKSQYGTEKSVVLGFDEIENIIGEPLPRSACSHRAWWSNQKDTSARSQARAWIEAGYIVDAVQQRKDGGTVRFVQSGGAVGTARGRFAPVSRGQGSGTASARAEAMALDTLFPPAIGWSPRSVITDFLEVAALAGTKLTADDIVVEVQPPPHKPPSLLPSGKMAVYVFQHGPMCLKVGKVGPNSQARYTSQHYNAKSAPSTPAASILADPAPYGAGAFDASTIGAWIKEHCSRVNLLLDAQHGMAVLSLLEAFLQCRLRPRYEGARSQRR